MRVSSRLISSLMIASYVLVAVAGSSLHHHAHEVGACGSSCSAPTEKKTCSHHGCSHSHAAETPESEHRPHQHGPHHDDDCFVCQVLAQKPLSTPQVTVVELSDRVYTAELAPIVSPALVVVSLPLTRGPPAV